MDKHLVALPLSSRHLQDKDLSQVVGKNQKERKMSFQNMSTHKQSTTVPYPHSQKQ